MPPDTVLVTGAGGFIGGRLVQRLALDEPVDVRPLLHSFSGPGAMRLARLPLDIKQGSVDDRERMREAIAGCDAVVHCAVGSKETTIDGTESVLRAAIDEGIETFIHMSSAVVHGHDIDGIVREESPQRPDTAYARWKVKAERTIADVTDDESLSPTIFRPYIVYGPGSQFVSEPVADIRGGAVLANGGDGIMNQIYVDNLVDAILLALKEPRARGETFLVCDEEDITWRRYYEELATMIDQHPPIRDASRQEIRLRNTIEYVSDSVLPPVHAIRRVARSDDVQRTVADELREVPWAMGLYSRLPKRARTSVQDFFYGGDTALFTEYDGASNSGGEPTYTMPSQRYAKLQSSKGRISNRKTKEILEWDQEIPFGESFDMLESWAEYAELV